MLYAFAISGREAELVRAIFTQPDDPARMNGRLLEIVHGRVPEMVKRLMAYSEAQGFKIDTAEHNLILRLVDRAARTNGRAILDGVKPTLPVTSEQPVPIVSAPVLVHSTPVETKTNAKQKRRRRR